MVGIMGDWKLVDRKATKKNGHVGVEGDHKLVSNCEWS